MTLGSSVDVPGTLPESFVFIKTFSGRYQKVLFPTGSSAYVLSMLCKNVTLTL